MICICLRICKLHAIRIKQTEPRNLNRGKRTDAPDIFRKLQKRIVCLMVMIGALTPASPDTAGTTHRAFPAFSGPKQQQLELSLHILSGAFELLLDLLMMRSAIAEPPHSKLRYNTGPRWPELINWPLIVLCCIKWWNGG